MYVLWSQPHTCIETLNWTRLGVQKGGNIQCRIPASRRLRRTVRLTLLDAGIGLVRCHPLWCCWSSYMSLQRSDLVSASIVSNHKQQYENHGRYNSTHAWHFMIKNAIWTHLQDTSCTVACNMTQFSTFRDTPIDTWNNIFVYHSRYTLKNTGTNYI